MNSTGTALPTIVASLAFLILAFIVAALVYDAVADDDMMGDMWHMMDGGMMDGRAGGSDETRGTASGQGDVQIVKFDYEPSVLEVTPGTVVTWTNEDSAPHTATGSGDNFDTGRLDRGGSSDITFETAGTYEYICTYHPYMIGRIVVSSPNR